jgi:hypothetical protein
VGLTPAVGPLVGRRVGQDVDVVLPPRGHR